MPHRLPEAERPSVARCSAAGSTAVQPPFDVSAAPALLTKEQVAKVLQVTPRTVHSYIESGELPAVKIGRRVRITTEDLRAFIERHRIHKPPSKA